MCHCPALAFGPMSKVSQSDESRSGDMELTWQLRKKMADANMFQTSELVEPLAENGVTLSREQVYRLVTKPPERLSLKTLAALCAIFSCTPNDLLLTPSD